MRVPARQLRQRLGPRNRTRRPPNFRHRPHRPGPTAHKTPCLTRPQLRKYPKRLKRAHPRLPLHAIAPTRYVFSFRSLQVVSGDKNTLFFDTNPPLRHISGVVSLHFDRGTAHGPKPNFEQQQFSADLQPHALADPFQRQMHERRVRPSLTHCAKAAVARSPTHRSRPTSRPHSRASRGFRPDRTASPASAASP